MFKLSKGFQIVKAKVSIYRKIEMKTIYEELQQKQPTQKSEKRKTAF